jgi:hypothetical protein
MKIIAYLKKYVFAHLKRVHIWIKGALEEGSNDRRLYPNFYIIEYDWMTKSIRLEFATDNETNLGQELQLKFFSWLN